MVVGTTRHARRRNHRSWGFAIRGAILLRSVFDLPGVIEAVPGDPPHRVSKGPPLFLHWFATWPNQPDDLVTTVDNVGLAGDTEHGPIGLLRFEHVLSNRLAVTTATSRALAKRRGRIIGDLIEVLPRRGQEEAAQRFLGGESLRTTPRTSIFAVCRL